MDPRPPLNCDQHWTRKRKERRENVKLETITCQIIIFNFLQMVDFSVLHASFAQQSLMSTHISY